MLSSRPRITLKPIVILLNVDLQEWRSLAMCVIWGVGMPVVWRDEGWPG